MELISLTTAGIIAASMATGAFLSKRFGKKGSSCDGIAGDVDQEKEQDISDLISKKHKG